VPLQIYETTGGRFDAVTNPAPGTVAVGTGTLTFQSCSAAALAYTFTGGSSSGASGAINLSRIGPTPQGCAVMLAEGLWRGTAPNNRTFFAIVLNDGTYYIGYSLAGAASLSGAVHGSGSAADGVFSSSNATDFSFRFGGFGFASSSVTGTYVPHSSLQLTSGTFAVSATYDAAYEKPASLAALAGSYKGFAGHLDDPWSMKASIDSSGVISASSTADCQFSGSVTPRASVNVFDFKIKTTGGVCIGGPGHTASGILYYDEATQQFYAFAPFDLGGGDMFFLTGAK
jgi:hypothetical protein